MKILLILALVAGGAAADSRPPDVVAGLSGAPVIDNVMIPPPVDTTMIIEPPMIDQAILIGPTRGLFGQLGQVAGVLADQLESLLTATLPRAI